jgi:hypothetical protein
MPPSKEAKRIGGVWILFGSGGQMSPSKEANRIGWGWKRKKESSPLPQSRIFCSCPWTRGCPEPGGGVAGTRP